MRICAKLAVLCVLQGAQMTKVLILYYSSYGHVEAMALAEAEGVRTAGGEAVVKRVPELVPLDVAQKSGFKLD
jgi:NAD(P)H dehydrogenase (quinone)